MADSLIGPSIIIIIIIIHEYYYGGAVALLLQDHLTMSVSRRESIYRETVPKLPIAVSKRSLKTFLLQQISHLAH